MAPAARRSRWTSKKDGQRGQGLVEYALIFVLIVIIAIAGLSLFGGTASGFINSIGTSV